MKIFVDKKIVHIQFEDTMPFRASRKKSVKGLSAGRNKTYSDIKRDFIDALRDIEKDCQVIRYTGRVLICYSVQITKDTISYDYDNLWIADIQDLIASMFLDPPDDSVKKCDVLYRCVTGDKESFSVDIVPDNKIDEFLHKIYGDIESIIPPLR